MLPYRTMLNSGSLFAAFTFGRPVIAPKLGCLSGYLTEDVAITYEAQDIDDLARAILESRRLKNMDARTAAYEKALEYSPDMMAADFASMVKRLVV